MAKKIRVDLEVKDRGSKDIKKFNKTTDKSFKKLKKSTKDVNAGFTKTISKLKLMAAAAIAFGAAAAMAFGKSAIDAASALQEVIGKFETVFRDQIGMAESFAKVLVDSYGVSERAAKQYLSSVQDLLKPMGMNSDAAAKMSNEVVKLAIDLGSFNDLPTERVMLDMQSALVGNFETMKKYGVILNETVVQTEAYSMGIAKQGDKLNANQKAIAAHSLMVKGSADAIGDWARTSGNYANQLKQLHSNVETFQAMLGKLLIPKVTEVVKQFNEWAKGAGNLEGALSKLITTMKILSGIALTLAVYFGVTFAAGIIGTTTAAFKLARGASALILTIGIWDKAVVALNTTFRALQMLLGKGVYGAIAVVYGIMLKLSWEFGKFLSKTKLIVVAADILGKAAIEMKHAWKQLWGKWTEEDKAALKKDLADHKRLITEWYADIEALKDRKYITIHPGKFYPMPKDDTETPPVEKKPYELGKTSLKAETMLPNYLMMDARERAAERLKIEEEVIAQQKEMWQGLREWDIEKASEHDDDIIEGYWATQDALVAKTKETGEEIRSVWVDVANQGISEFASGIADIATGAQSAKEAFADMARSMSRWLVELGMKIMMVAAIKSAFGMTGGSLISFDKGGITPEAATGGRFSGPDSGYPVMMHGSEAVVPLPDGKSIPVDLGGAGGITNNITVNVQQSGGDAASMKETGNIVSRAIKTEMDKWAVNNKRSGGILNKQSEGVY